MNLCIIAESGRGGGCCLSKCNCTICLCVFSEALSSVEKIGSTSARVDILSTSRTTVSLGVGRSSFPSTVNAGVVFSSKVLNLDSGSWVTDVTPETMEKLVSHGDVNLDRTVIYLSVVVLAIVVALHSGCFWLDDNISSCGLMLCIRSTPMEH